METTSRPLSDTPRDAVHFLDSVLEVGKVLAAVAAIFLAVVAVLSLEAA